MFQHLFSRPYSQSETQTTPFIYRLGASSSGKITPLQEPKHGLNYFTSSVIESAAEGYFSSIKKYSGEDAFFMSHVASSNRYAIFGIADGVGGWQNQGIDPSKFSHGLCRYMAEGTGRPEKEGDLAPVNLLQRAYDLVLGDKKVHAGGSTAVVARMEPQGTMEVAK